MNERLAIAIEELSTLIKNDARIKELEELEKAILEDEEVVSYINKKESALLAYNDALKVKDIHDPFVLTLQSNLFEAKKALDALPLVKKYNDIYKEVASLYRQVDDCLFYPYCGLRIFARK